MLRSTVYAVLLALLSTACAPIGRRSELEPALHPLLERPTGGHEPLSGAGPVDVSTDADPELASQRRKLAMRALSKLDGAAEVAGAPATDLALIAAVFGDLRLDAGPEHAGHAATLHRLSRTRVGAPRPADLAFFSAPGFGLRVGVVRRVLPGGVVEVAFVTRGAIRTVRVDRANPELRRRGSEIVNTFIRPKRPDDAPRTRHLAGQLVESYRTLLD